MESEGVLRSAKALYYYLNPYSEYWNPLPVEDRVGQFKKITPIINLQFIASEKELLEAKAKLRPLNPQTIKIDANKHPWKD